MATTHKAHLMQAVSALPTKRVRLSSSYQEGEFTLLWWLLRSYSPRHLPGDIVAIGLQLAHRTGYPLEYWEHLADRLQAALTPNEAKEIALEEIRRLF